MTREQVRDRIMWPVLGVFGIAAIVYLGVQSYYQTIYVDKADEINSSDMPEAMSLYQKYIDKYPDSSDEVRLKLGDDCMAERNYDRASKLYDDVLYWEQIHKTQDESYIKRADDGLAAIKRLHNNNLQTQ